MTAILGSLGRGWVAVRAALMGALMALAACGGGGGGDTPSSTVAVTVGGPQVTALNAEVLADGALPDVVLTGSVSGDVNILNGRTIYVIVEDTASLFDPAATLQLQQAGSNWLYTLTLRGRVLSSPGLRTGNLRIFVCLDLQCNTRLAGTPISIPFNVNVLPGLVLSTTAINVSVPFGTVPPDQLVDVTLSSFSNNWVPSDVTPFSATVAKTMTVVGAGQLTSASRLTIRLSPAAPGTYTERARVHTTATVGGLTRSFDVDIDVNYTVTPSSSVDYVFSPPSLLLDHVVNDPLVKQSGYQLVTNDGVTQTWQGVVFDPPPVANPTGPYNSWWDDFRRESHVCTATIGNGGVFIYDCMQPGTYTARVQYLVTGPSGSNVVEFPITLTVTP